MVRSRRRAERYAAASMEDALRPCREDKGVGDMIGIVTDESDEDEV